MAVARDAGGGRLRNLLGSVAVLAVAGVIAVGLPALDRQWPAARPVPADRPYLVGGGVRLVPPPGALVDVTKTRPLADRGTVLFLVGEVRYVVVVLPFAGSLAAAAKRLREKITSTRGYRLTGPEIAIDIASVGPGLGAGYTAPGRVGRYLVVLLHGMAVEITISGTRADIATAMAAIEVSLRTLTYRARR